MYNNKYTSNVTNITSYLYTQSALHILARGKKKASSGRVKTKSPIERDTIKAFQVGGNTKKSSGRVKTNASIGRDTIKASSGRG
jgi:hypothetical protein